MRKIDTEDLLKLKNNRLVLPIILYRERENFIEVVTQKVKAGYLNAYLDPEYIEIPQQISLPFFGFGKTQGVAMEEIRCLHT